MERECLDLLLRGTQPVVVCLARSLEGVRIPAVWRQAIEAGRMLVVSQFPAGCRRVTGTTALQRNELVANLASAIVVIHASPNSHTLALCERALAGGKPVFALSSFHNSLLAAMGAQMISPKEVTSVQTAFGG
jgi:predicted Rossmann fold nucleotide-binding protein DprA/Smf involved in DNA uptake